MGKEYRSDLPRDWWNHRELFDAYPRKKSPYPAREKVEKAERRALKRIIRPEASLTSDQDRIYSWLQENGELRRQRNSETVYNQMLSFREIHGAKKVERDWLRLKKVKAENLSDKNMRGEILEAILSQTGEHHWFGENAFVSEASRYDDLLNGIDLILEVPGSNGETVHIGIDCTLTKKEDVLKKKALTIREGIEIGTMAKVEYFSSDNNNEKRSLRYLPKIIFNLDSRQLTKLSEEFVSVVNRDKGSNESFSESHWQYFFIAQAEEQLQFQLALLAGIKENSKGEMDERNRQSAWHKCEVELSRALEAVRNLKQTKEQKYSKFWKEEAEEELKENYFYSNMEKVYTGNSDVQNDQ